MSEPGKDRVENPLGFHQQDPETSSSPLPVPPERHKYFVGQESRESRWKIRNSPILEDSI